MGASRDFQRYIFIENIIWSVDLVRFSNRQGFDNLELKLGFKYSSHFVKYCKEMSLKLLKK